MVLGKPNCDQDKPHLARIRENQRRSRQRRREYLQELEGRWRRCEEAGAAASSELQQVARKVAQENRALRALLRERGVADAEIDDYLARVHGRPQGATLDTVLATRKNCGNTCAPASSSSASRSVADTAPPCASTPAKNEPSTQAPVVSQDVPPAAHALPGPEIHPDSTISPPGSGLMLDPLVPSYAPPLAPPTSTLTAEMAPMFPPPFAPSMDYSLATTAPALGGTCCAPGIHCEPLDVTAFKIINTYDGQSLPL